MLKQEMCHVRSLPAPSPAPQLSLRARAGGCTIFTFCTFLQTLQASAGCPDPLLSPARPTKRTPAIGMGVASAC